MTISLYAQPYSNAAQGFFFSTIEEYDAKRRQLRDRYGNSVEEFEIQFIDGEKIDSALAKTIGLSQANCPDFLACVDAWTEWQKQKAIIAVGKHGYQFDLQADPDDYDIDLYHVESMRELAEQFVDEGLFGNIPERLQFYIDYDAIARDLAVEYSEIAVAGKRLVYRAG